MAKPKRIYGKGVRVVVEIKGERHELGDITKTRVVFTKPQRWRVETALTDYWYFRFPNLLYHAEVAVRALRDKVRAVTFEVDVIEKKHLLQAIDNAIFNSQSQGYGNTLRRARAAVENFALVAPGEANDG